MNTYAEVIKHNCDSISPVLWWPKFAYHFTDVTHAASILSSGLLYSRNKATALGMMENENASRQIIDITNPDVKTNARLYFRPETPTQFYNEGFKHKGLRYDDANIPVPIFLLFDLERLLSTPGVQFSEKTQAGQGSQKMSGIEAFKELNFKKIYSSGPFSDLDTTSYRQAEILYPDMLPIDDFIQVVLCRNSIYRRHLI